MSNQEKKTGGVHWLVLVIIGAIIMVAGMYVAVNIKIPFQEGLAKQGIPLDLGRTIATIGVFIILFPVIKSFFLVPLAEAINNRTTELEKTFSEAEELRSEMKSMQSAYEKRLAETEADAREKIQGQIKEAQALRQRLESEAVGRADELLKRAHDEISAERNKVVTELRLEVVNLTLGATEKLLGENMDTDKNRRLINDFVNKVEVPS
jgi:F-type H+-transporting ATPase subunit b